MTRAWPLLAALLCSAPALAQVPSMVQHLSANAQPEADGETGNNWKFTLPNVVQVGNTLVLFVNYDNASAPTGVSDTINGSWPAATVTANDGTGAGHVAARAYVFPNAAAGTTTVTIAFAGNILGFSYTVSEWNNVANASPVDKFFSGAGVTGPTVVTNSQTTTAAGDLILQYASSDGDAFNHAQTNWTAGSGFTLVDANIAWGQNIGGGGLPGLNHATQYQIQSAAGAIAPSITATQTTHDNFVTVAVALKAATAGSAAAAGTIRIRRIVHYTTDVWPAGAYTIQFPTDGNLLVFSSAGDITTGLQITSITDTNSNAWAIARAPVTDQLPEIWYAANATTSSDLFVTLHYTGTPPTESLVMYDIAGADAAPLVTGANNATLTSHTPPFTFTDEPVFTPPQLGLVIVSCMAGQGPYNQLGTGSPATAVFDAVNYTNQTDGSHMDNSDGYAHLYTPDLSTEHWNWSLTGTAGGSSSSGGTLVLFKAAPPTGPNVDTSEVAGRGSARRRMRKPQPVR